MGATPAHNLYMTTRYMVQRLSWSLVNIYNAVSVAGVSSPAALADASATHGSYYYDISMTPTGW